MHSGPTKNILMNLEEKKAQHSIIRGCVDGMLHAFIIPPTLMSIQSQTRLHTHTQMGKTLLWEGIVCSDHHLFASNLHERVHVHSDNASHTIPLYHRFEICTFCKHHRCDSITCIELVFNLEENLPTTSTDDQNMMYLNHFELNLYRYTIALVTAALNSNIWSIKFLLPSICNFLNRETVYTNELKNNTSQWMIGVIKFNTHRPY